MGIEIKIILYYLAAVNVIAFCSFGADKSKARRGARRISERTLLLLAAAGGAAGALWGMKLFHHKTLHRKFTWGVPIILLLQIAAAAWAALSH